METSNENHRTTGVQTSGAPIQLAILTLLAGISAAHAQTAPAAGTSPAAASEAIPGAGRSAKGFTLQLTWACALSQYKPPRTVGINTGIDF